MKTREFGSTGIRASEVGFGLWTISTGWWGEHSDEDAITLLREAYDLGITFFDTADTYGEGRGETLLARALGHVRDRITIATKFGYDIYSPWERKGHVERPHDWSPEYIRYALDQSLARLDTDHIDVYQLHNPRMDAIRSDDVFAVLEEAVAAGKIRSYGVALGPAIGWRDEGLEAFRTRDIAAGQIIHNLLEQDPGRELIEARSDHIDVYQLHNPRMDAIRSDDVFAVLEEAVAAGKIRSYGVALGPAIGWRDEGLEAFRTRDIAAGQIIHNLLEQDPGRELIEA